MRRAKSSWEHPDPEQLEAWAAAHEKVQTALKEGKSSFAAILERMTMRKMQMWSRYEESHMRDEKAHDVYAELAYWCDDLEKEYGKVRAL